MSFALLCMLFGILVFCPEAGFAVAQRERAQGDFKVPHLTQFPHSCTKDSYSTGKCYGRIKLRHWRIQVEMERIKSTFCGDGGSLTWNEPPPIKTVQAGGILVDHESRRQLHEGTINANLSWQFNLTDLKFIFLVLSFNRRVLAVAKPWEQAVVPWFQKLFGIEWIANQTFVRLIIFNVTFEKHGTFTCRVHVKREDSLSWQFKSNVQVDVVAPPMVTLASKVYVGREQAASLICEVKGNPTPTISWSPCYGTICDEKYFNISKVQTTRANYTCTANNTVGVDSATTLLLIGGKNVYLRLSLAGECNSKDSVWMTLQKELGKVFSKTQGYSLAELIDVRCESLIFDVVLKFGFRVAEDDTVSIIQSAIVDGKLGDLRENVSFIIGIAPVKQITTMAPTSTTPKSDGGTSAPSTTEATSAETGSVSAPSTSEPTSAETGGSAGPQWAIIGGVAGGIVVLGIVVVVSWWVHMRRKPRKDTTGVSHPDLELKRHEEVTLLTIR